MEKQNEFQNQRWHCPVDEEGVLTLPDELWQTLGWQEGDELQFIDNEDGSFSIVKVNEDQHAYRETCTEADGSI